MVGVKRKNIGIERVPAPLHFVADAGGRVSQNASFAQVLILLVREDGAPFRQFQKDRIIFDFHHIVPADRFHLPDLVDERVRPVLRAELPDAAALDPELLVLDDFFENALEQFLR